MRNKGGREGGKLLELVSDFGDRCPFLFYFGRHLGLIPFPRFSLCSSTIVLVVLVCYKGERHVCSTNPNRQVDD
jgi:hypothetical protein